MNLTMYPVWHKAAEYYVQRCHLQAEGQEPVAVEDSPRLALLLESLRDIFVRCYGFTEMIKQDSDVLTWFEMGDYAVCIGNRDWSVALTVYGRHAKTDCCTDLYSQDIVRIVCRLFGMVTVNRGRDKFSIWHNSKRIDKKVKRRFEQLDRYLKKCS